MTSIYHGYGLIVDIANHSIGYNLNNLNTPWILGYKRYRFCHNFCVYPPRMTIKPILEVCVSTYI